MITLFLAIPFISKNKGFGSREESEVASVTFTDDGFFLG